MDIISNNTMTHPIIDNIRASLVRHSFLIYFLIGEQLLYRILLFSVKPQHEWAIGVHLSPSFWTSLPSLSPSHPSRLIQAPVWIPKTNSKFPLAIYFIYGNVSFHVILSIHLTPVFLPGKSHGWRSLAGYSQWGHKELNMTEQLQFHSQIGVRS